MCTAAVRQQQQEHAAAAGGVGGGGALARARVFGGFKGRQEGGWAGAGVGGLLQRGGGMKWDARSRGCRRSRQGAMAAASSGAGGGAASSACAASGAGMSRADACRADRSRTRLSRCLCGVFGREGCGGAPSTRAPPPPPPAPPTHPPPSPPPHPPTPSHPPHPPTPPHLMHVSLAMTGQASPGRVLALAGARVDEGGTPSRTHHSPLSERAGAPPGEGASA